MVLLTVNSGHLKTNINRLHGLLLKCDEKFLNDEISKEVYDRLVAKYKYELSQLKQQHSEVQLSNLDSKKIYNGLSLLCDLPSLYENAPTE